MKVRLDQVKTDSYPRFIPLTLVGREFNPLQLGVLNIPLHSIHHKSEFAKSCTAAEQQKTFFTSLYFTSFMTDSCAGQTTMHGESSSKIYIDKKAVHT